MTTKKNITILIAAVCLLALVVQAGEVSMVGKATSEIKTDDESGIKWYTYEDGWKKAKSENKHMFVDFTATWCGWCKKLEKTTFSVPEVIDALNNDFVSVKVWDKSGDTITIDGYTMPEANLKKQFQVRGFPALWFVSPEGLQVGPIGGYLEADRMLKYLDHISNYRYDSTRTETGKKIPTKSATGSK